jgi:hypothetical protein
MPKHEWQVDKEQSVLDSGAGNSGNGKDDHAPIGLYSGHVYRELLRFDPDYGGAYQHIRSRLYVRRTSEVHVVFGANPRVLVRRTTGAWQQGGGAEGSWSSGASTVYPGPSTTTSGQADSLATLGTTDEGWDWIDITDIVDAILPTRVLKSTGQDGGGAPNHGIMVLSFDQGSTGRTFEFYSCRAPASKRPYVEFTYSDNRPPDMPSVTGIVGAVAGTSDPVIVGTTGGDRLAVEYGYSDPDGDAASQVELEIYPQATTDETATNANRRATTGAIPVGAPIGQGSHRVTIMGLVPGADSRHRLRVRDARGQWSAWTSLADGRFRTAYRPGVPLNPVMTTDRAAPTISGTLFGPGTISGWEGEFYRDDATGRTTLWAPGMQEIGGSSTRSTIDYGGTTPLDDGQVVRWRHRHRNQDGVVGDWSPEYSTIMRTQVGPTVSPSSTATKLTTRTPDITITADSFDGYAYRLFRGDTQIHPPSSGGDTVIAVSATTSVVITLPEGLLAWGETFGFQAAVRPATSGQLGLFSPIVTLYIDTLPATTIAAGDGDLVHATVVPTTDVLWVSPYLDPDEQGFGEVPTAKELVVRVAATPQGSGGLVFWRTNAVAGQIPEDERTGRQLDPLTSAAGVTYEGANIDTGVNATAPAGYAAGSLEVLATSGDVTTRGALVSCGAEDLSVFGAQAYIRLWRRVTSVTNLTSWALRFIFSGTYNDWAQYTIATGASTPNAWAEAVFVKALPAATNGTVDWSAWTGEVYLICGPSGAYTGELQVRDLRIGETQFDAAVPSGSLTPESSYDARARYRDDAAALIATTIAADFGQVTNVKLASVAGLSAGMDLTVGSGAVEETRTIVTVGTAGSGGTGVTVSDAFVIGGATGYAAKVHPWGQWTPWITRKVSIPPTVAADTPADLALITDPTPTLAHTFSSPGGKAQALRTTNVYRRTGYALRAMAMGFASYWRLDEASGNVLDAVGGVTGTVSGTVTRQVEGALEPGDTDTGLGFGGGSVSFGDVYDLAGTTPFTIAGWLKLTSIPTAGTYAKLLDKETGGNGWYLLCGNGNAYLTFTRVVAWGSENAASPDVTIGVWQHIAVIYDGTTMTVYVDGVPGAPASSSGSLANTAEPLVMGDNAVGGVQPLPGAMDDWGVCLRALSAAEVLALHRAQAEVPGESLHHTSDEIGTGLTDTLPALLLTDATAFSWEVTAYDTDALAGTTTRRVFSTSFDAVAAITGLTATADAASGAVVLAWDASADTHLHHYRVLWRNAAGQDIRIDGGPETVDDGRPPLTTPTLTHHGARLGVNAYRVTAHDGVIESEPAAVDVTMALEPGIGHWQIVTEEDERHTMRLTVPQAPRVWNGDVEADRPPGRGSPVHRFWGLSGRSVSLTTRYRPDVEGDHLTALSEMWHAGTAFWLKSPPGNRWDVMRVRIVALSDAVEPYGWTSLGVEMDEVLS